MADAVGLVTVGVEILERAAPGGLALVRSWIKGKTIVVVGQARAGKTTFLDYLHYGTFLDETQTLKTLEISSSARFNVSVGRNSTLELIVKSVVDLPGQTGPVAHADAVFERKPHAIVVVTDLTTPLNGEPEQASGAWLLEFCRRLEARWRAKGTRGNKLQSLVVLMNKVDKPNAESPDVRRKRFERIVNSELRDARGKMTQDIRVLPCSLVTNAQGTKLVDHVIKELAKDLAR